MTCEWTGVFRLVFRKLPTVAVIPTFMMNLGGKLPVFDNFFANFWKTHPRFKENLPKKGPLLREFWTQKHTHIGGIYPYPQHVMSSPGHLEMVKKMGV